MAGCWLTGSQLNPNENFNGDEWDNYQRTLGYINFDLRQNSTIGGADDAFNRLSNTWVYGTNRTVIGTYAEAPIGSFTEKVTYDDLYAVVGSTTLNKTNNANIEVYIDGANSVSLTIPATLRNNDDGLAAAGGEFTGNGTLTEIYLDSNDAVRIVVINSYLATVTSDYDENDETVEIEDSTAANYTLSLEDFAGIVNYREDDKLVITVADGEVQSVAPATVVEGAEVTAFGSNNVTANGTNYKNNLTATADDIADYDIADADLSYTLYLDSYGYVLGSKGVNATGAYVFISAWEKTGGAVTGNDTYTAQAYFTDGTKAVIDVKDTDEINWTAGEGETPNYSVNRWYTYTVNSSDVYTLTQEGISNTTLGADKDVNSETENVTLSAGVRADSGTVFIFMDNEGKDVASTSTGIRNVDFTVNAANGAYVVSKDGAAEAVIVYNYDGVATGDYIFILGNNSSFNNYDRTNETAYYTYDAIVDGAKTTVNALDNDLTAGAIYNAKYAYDGLYLAENLAPETTDTATDDRDFIGQVGPTAYRNGTLTLTASNAYVLADDCALLTVDGKTVTSRTATNLVSLSDGANDDFYHAPAIVILNSDGEATCVMVIKGVALDNAGMTAVSEKQEAVADVVNTDGQWSGHTPAGDFDIVGTEITGSYGDSTKLASGLVNDLPRFLAELHNEEGAAVETIVYDGVSYTWNSELEPNSKWVAADGTTLVKAITDDFKAEVGVTGELDAAAVANILGDLEVGKTYSYSFNLSLDGVEFTYTGSYTVPAGADDGE